MKYRAAIQWTRHKVTNCFRALDGAHLMWRYEDAYCRSSLDFPIVIKALRLFFTICNRLADGLQPVEATAQPTSTGGARGTGALRNPARCIAPERLVMLCTYSAVDSDCTPTVHLRKKWFNTTMTATCCVLMAPGRPWLWCVCWSSIWVRSNLATAFGSQL